MKKALTTALTFVLGLSSLAQASTNTNIKVKPVSRPKHEYKCECKMQGCRVILSSAEVCSCRNNYDTRDILKQLRKNSPRIKTLERIYELD